ncbi:hypothetical protein [Nocardia sp. NPDC003345]
MSVFGFLTEVAVGATASRFIPGMKGVLVGSVGGSLAHNMLDGTVGVSELLTDAGLAAVGGATMHGVNNRLISKGLGEWSGKSAKALAKAEEPSKQLASKVNDLKAATRAHIRARTDYSRMNWRQKATPEGIRLRKSLGPLEKARTDARAAAKQSSSAANQAADKLAKAKRTDKWAQGFNNQFGNGTSLLHNWGRAGLIGLGAAAVPALYGAAKPDPGGDGTGGEQGPGTEQKTSQTPLVWDGLDPATSAGVMWTAPFDMDPSVEAGGTGFLLRPRDLDIDLVKWYGADGDSFAFSVVDNHQMFGDPKLKKPLELTAVPTLPPASGLDGSHGGESYGDVLEIFQAKAERLTESQKVVAESVGDEVDKIQEQGLKDIASLIKGVNTVMQDIPDASPANFLTVLTQAFAELIQTMDDAAAANELAAQKIDEKTAESDKKASEDLANSVNRFANQAQDPGYTADSSRIGVNNPFDPGNIPGYNPTASSADLKDATEKFRKDAEDLQNRADIPQNQLGGSGSGLNPSTSTPAAYNPNMSGLGATDAMGGMGGMSGLMSSLLPMMMQQAAMRNMTDSDMSGRMRDLDPSRYDRAAAPTMPQAQPAATTPWSNNQAATGAAPAQAQPAHHQTGAPNGATSTQTGAGAPRRVPGEDGLVPYSFPDGRSQRVSPAVAQGLDKAFANKSGTDAQTAYDGTAAAWTDPKDIGLAVDPSQLMTGDVATWTIAASKEGTKAPAEAQAVVSSLGGDPGSAEGESGDSKKPERKSEEPKGDPGYRTAILVAFGEGESGTLEAVVSGELQQYAADMTDGTGPFGDFAGFKHPKGVEATGDKGQDVDGAAEPAATDVPALAPA